MGEIGFTADIESMFYAFHLPKSDLNFARFFWWKDNDPRKDLMEYRATRHVFGNKSSPSLANIGLRYAIYNSPQTSQKAIESVKRNFYVDDFCGAADTVEEAVSVLQELRSSLSHFKIRLCKITSSSDEVCHSFPQSELSESAGSKDFNLNDSHRTLGIEWRPDGDYFIIKSNVPLRPFTKRGMLATTNSFFDPLGFASPVILAGRLLQRFFIPSKHGDPHIVGLDWDDPLPEEHRHLWDDWVESLLESESQAHIPRGFTPRGFGRVSERSLHVFSDASTEGVGFVAYLRCVNVSGDVYVSLVFASSKVPPRGTSSIPRLELCAALDAAVSGYRIATDINLDHTKTTFYQTVK